MEKPSSTGKPCSSKMSNKQPVSSYSGPSRPDSSQPRTSQPRSSQPMKSMATRKMLERELFGDTDDMDIEVGPGYDSMNNISMCDRDFRYRLGTKDLSATETRFFSTF
ncbi:uncharacterized protein LOC129743563 isoform X2 [Uranotaenia lowii]|uniref:uncharacterized protein LOC129743563 isoform X2 n=1 Tax=Uranotaenia lowii TaxID=190385 RepID=UPI002479F7DE|nr:uncharacterized protein LOC129743563 isoform X2 [Uranotaenia lowii]